MTSLAYRMTAVVIAVTINTRRNPPMTMPVRTPAKRKRETDLDIYKQ